MESYSAASKEVERETGGTASKEVERETGGALSNPVFSSFDGSLSGSTGVAEYSASSCSDPNEVTVKAIAIGGQHICVLTDAGGVRCWGDNGWGQLGSGTTESSLALPKDDVLKEVAAISTGTLHTCALTLGGGVRCWGGNRLGQLGNGKSGQYAHDTAPPDEDVLTDSSGVAAGNGHTCVLKNSGEVVCWGYNDASQLGIPSTSFDNDGRPGRTVEKLEAQAISAGYAHNCAVTNDVAQRVRCWGDNSMGQLELQSSGTPLANWVPQEIGDLAGVKQIVAGKKHTCARMSGSFRCWGRYASSGTGLGGLTQIAAGADQTCVLVDGGVYCWVGDEFGQFGEGQLGPLMSAPLLTDVAAIVAGGGLACALKRNRGVRCWGDKVYCKSGACWNGKDGCQFANPNDAKCTTPMVPEGLCSD